MRALPADLDSLCQRLFEECDKFDSVEQLRALFKVKPLDPFVNLLPISAPSKCELVAQVKLLLLDKRLQDGTVLLVPFIERLSDAYPTEEWLHNELHNLHQQMLAFFQSRPNLSPTQPVLADALQQYYEYLRVEVFADGDGYCPLSATLETREGPEERIEDVRHRIRDYQRVVLLGEPGAGKTTVLQRIALDFLAENVLPIFVRLGGFRGQVSFQEYAYDQVDDTVRGQIDQVDRLWLFDGLNEMPRKDAAGQELLPYLQDFIRQEIRRARNKTRFILSCRTQDYEDDLEEIRDVTRITLCDLSPRQIKSIINSRLSKEPVKGSELWAELYKPGTDEALFAVWDVFGDHAQNFWREGYSLNDLRGQWSHPIYPSRDLKKAWRAIFQDDRKLLLQCRNPLILKMVIDAFVHDRGKLPGSEAELIANFIRNRLEDEANAAKRRGDSWERGMISLIERMLRRLALVMQFDETSTDIDLEQAHESLSQDLELQRAIEHRSKEWKREITDADLLEVKAKAAGLIWILGSARVSFVHKRIQEYFAAAALHETVKARKQVDLESWLANQAWWEDDQYDAWHETVRVLARFQDYQPADIETVAGWLAPFNPEIAFELWASIRLHRSDYDEIERVALARLATSTLDSGLCKRIVSEAAKKAADTAEDPRGRAAVYRVLGALNADQRLGTGLYREGPLTRVPEIDWVLVDTEGARTLDGKELRAFQIARYPVTYVQFKAFCDDPEGYTSPNWYDRLTDQDCDYRQKAPLTNHPAENVTWFAAVAFTRWLTSRYVQAGQIAADEEIRLPTRDEWLTAAVWNAALKRRMVFPWSDHYEPGCANVKENSTDNSGPTNLARTTAVGIYPAGQSHCGALDLIGNVWEWTLTPIRTGGSRILCGGSYKRPVNEAKAQYLCDYTPYDSDSDIGFRVVRVHK